MKRWTPLLTLVLFAVVLLAIAGAASACPMCKDSLSDKRNNIPGGSFGGGFNASIYCMLLGFFGAVSVVGFNLYRGIRR
jgi:hypothetical protein